MLGKVSAFPLPVVTPASLLEKGPLSSRWLKSCGRETFFSETMLRESDDQWLWVRDPAEPSRRRTFEKLPRPSRCRERARTAAPARREHNAGAPARRRCYGSGGVAAVACPGCRATEGCGGRDAESWGASSEDGPTSLVFLLTVVSLHR